MNPRERPRLLPCGDSALSVEFGDAISLELHARVIALDRALRGRPGLRALVPTYRSLFIHYDPLEVSFEQIALAVEAWWAEVELPEGEEEPPSEIVEIPVCYDPALGPDLEEVARLRGLTVEEVVALHSRRTYRVYMLGFTPGFLFLGTLDPRIQTPRLPEPRERVPAGSVGIAGPQTGAYAIESPGGWRLLGRTPVRLFDPDRSDPTVAKPGMGVRFRPISLERFRELGGEPG